ncbi:hypothetical protein COK00_24405 [Bacillus cereus]|uniref:Uncharacterized protein n=2 Tax=Bacillus cereus group TaxID=86661 RepID=A0A1C4BDV4_BACTU|nr:MULTISPECIES: hypothetical protein [Bacillus cereus group]MCC2324949.1 hypothetical protein [Bacillus wiedmannii]MED2015545.1 hypothetical protein [Bacillus wiedmannii]MED3023550.1 hypothetical protein [Bacillus wiedmannii]OTX96777.1 hypothetical protein BK729_18355 [Bacillus thuringiensis serovar wratislaviensis]OUB57527.1 hypothetical protein BK743_16345 [Bacillus thuringiensis serovar sylvestriensis]
MRFSSLKGGYLRGDIESKGMVRGFVLDKQQVHELSSAQTVISITVMINPEEESKRADLLESAR